MLESAIVYSGLVVTAAGIILAIRPIERLHITNRSQGLVIAGIGVVVAGIGLRAPAPMSRVSRSETHLDEFVPAWQFNERHAITVNAPPDKVYAALKQVRADEVAFFRTLTWIRRGGRALPQGILNAGSNRPLLDVATHGGFIYLADDAPREIVIGTPVVTPRGNRAAMTPQLFKSDLPPGFVLGAMNFVISPEGQNASRVITETRVLASSDRARRRFAVYWRLIYPGSAIIRRMWLRAVRQRAESPSAP
ncbi:MAG: hypothetical protein M3Z54_01350 [Gemmatimonadota bacterium]|nr:hypothetical protein [Gemmatimonadota bacterium]